MNLPSALLLRHHRARIVYAVSLIRNLGDHLLGLARKPEYLVPLDDGRVATAAIGAWWRERWLRNTDYLRRGDRGGLAPHQSPPGHVTARA